MRRKGAALLGLLLVACTGHIGESSYDADAPGLPVDAPAPGPNVNEDPGVVGSPSESTLLRMTKEQHRLTLQAVLFRFLGEHAAPVWEAVDPVYAIIPDDTSDLDLGGLVGASFSRMSQVVGELHIRGYFEVAKAVAEMIAFDPVRREAVLGECTSEPGSGRSPCIGDFLDDFGLWVLRRPLNEEERAFYIDTVFADEQRDYTVSPEALRDLITALLSSPDFLYFVNRNGEELAEGLYELDAYALATRLSFHFWNSMPDQELLDAAADGRLETPSGYAEQVERLYADPRASETFRRFFFEWLELHEAGDPYGGVGSGDVQKTTFLDGYEVSPELRDRMIAELLDMADYYRENGTFEDLFTSNASFATTEDLAAIYEAPVWSGVGDPETFSNPERMGLLGRAALLTAATVSTHPILRGVRIREDFMCDALGEPPANVNDVEIDAQAIATTRERTEALTSPGSCSGCHTFINGLGFPLEAFDSLGRHRTEEMVIDVEGNVTMLPVDTVAVPFIGGAGDTTTVSGPADLVEQLMASGRLEPCFARHYVRFSLGLLSDPAFGGDAETIEALASVLRSGAPLGEFFKKITYLPAFKQRFAGGSS